MEQNKIERVFLNAETGEYFEMLKKRLLNIKEEVEHTSNKMYTKIDELKQKTGLDETQRNEDEEVIKNLHEHLTSLSAQQSRLEIEIDELEALKKKSN